MSGLGTAKKVGAGDGLRVEPFFGLEFLGTFFSMKKVSTKIGKCQSPAKLCSMRPFVLPASLLISIQPEIYCVKINQHW